MIPLHTEEYFLLPVVEEGKSPQPRLRVGMLASEAKAAGLHTPQAIERVLREVVRASLWRRLPYP
ncbi:MAG: hypothetical protein HY067_09390 [Betaproteobacteria bacterium]|nr:hypothetical protein [Betaproteobacteria bacterium]